MIKIAIIIILVLLTLGGFYFIVSQRISSRVVDTIPPTENNLSESTQSSNLSDDPAYQDVKNKYNLTEEQLQILSTVSPGDN